jgi:hypothetical protein
MKVDETSALKCSISFDEWNSDADADGLPMINILVENSSNDSLRFPCWLLTGSPIDVLSLRVEGEELATPSSTPHSEDLNKAIIELPAQQNIVWQIKWPSSFDSEKLVGKDLALSVRWFDNSDPIAFSLEKYGSKLRIRE